MDYDYLKRVGGHNKVIKRNKFIYKFFCNQNKYKNEKEFYLKTKDKLWFIPKLYYFSDKRKLLIIENVGKHITEKELIKEQEWIIILFKIMIMKTGYYHNDLYYKNVCKNSKNQYFLIDFENCYDRIKNNHKKSNLFRIDKLFV